MLSSMDTNRRSIEPQLMKKFCQTQQFSSLDLSIQSDVFSNIFSNRCNSNYDYFDDSKAMKLAHTATSRIDLIESFSLTESCQIQPLPPFKVKSLSSEQHLHLQKVYEQLYPSRNIARVPHFYREYGRALLGDDILGCVMHGRNSKKTSVICAYWPGTGNSLSSIDYSQKRVGVIQFFLLHSLEVFKQNTGENSVEKLVHLLAYVRWNKLHPESNWFGQSSIVTINMMELPDACCYMPIKRISNVCAMPVKFTHHTETDLLHAHCR